MNKIKAVFLLIVCFVSFGCATMGKTRSPAVPLSEEEVLRNLLQKYVTIQTRGGWGVIPSGSTLEKGMKDPRVSLVKKRLQISGEFAEKETKNSFNRKLENSVHEFQIAHGLEADGKVGKATLQAMNVPVSERIRQLRQRLSEGKVISKQSQGKFIVVNIPDLRLKLIENDQPVLESKIIVGQKDWATPTFSGTIRKIIVNPPWNVPPSIFSKELIEDFRKDPGYLKKHNMFLVSTLEGMPPPAPESIDWNQVDPEKVNFRIVQKEGEGNPLGRLKFVFYNPHDIYLHDTSDPALFARTARDLSHGCIRVEKARDLALLLLQGGSVDAAKLEELTKTEKTQALTLPSPVKIHIVYRTVWVDKEGRVHFRNDIYKDLPPPDSQNS